MKAIRYTTLIIVLATGLTISALAAVGTTSDDFTTAFTPTIYGYLPMVVKPEETPRPPPEGVIILPNDSFYMVGDFLFIIGEVQNNTSSSIRFVKNAVILFNNSGQQLATESNFIYAEPLSSGDTACFRFILDDPPNWAYYEFEEPTYQTYNEPILNISIFNDNGLYDSAFGDYDITGQVRNDDSTRAEFVRLVGTVFNTSGIVLDCNITFPDDGSHLDPSQTSLFDISFIHRDYADVASYRLQAGYRP